MKPAISKIALCCLLVLGECGAARVAQATWAPEGNLICSVAGDQRNPVMCSDGAGGAIVVWVDTRQRVPLTSLFAQRILADGSLAWRASGVLIAKSYDPAVVYPDGDGGAYVFFNDPTGVKRFVDLTADGTIAPGWPAEGRILAPVPHAGIAGLRLAADHTLDVLTITGISPTETQTLRLSRVDLSGALLPGWPAGGIEIASSTPGWSSYGVGLFARSSLGTTWLAVTHVSLSEYDPANYLPVLKGYGSDGTLVEQRTLHPWSPTAPPALGIVSLGDDVITLSPDVARYRPHADNLWTSTPLLPFIGTTTSDDAGGFWSVRPSPCAVYRVTADGEIPSGFPATGLSLPGPEMQTLNFVTEDGDLWLARSFVLNGVTETFVTRVHGDGTFAPGWSEVGKRVSTTPGAGVTDQRIVPNRSGGLLAAWVEAQTPTNLDVRVGLVSPDVVVGVNPGTGRGPGLAGSLSARALSPHALEVRFRSESDAPLTLELLDVTGRSHARLDVAGGPGAWRTVAWPTPELASGIYWVRARQTDQAASARVLVIR